MAENYIPKIQYGSGPTTITFDYPPEGFDSQGKTINAVQTVSYSADGTEQTSTQYNEEIINLRFKLVSDSLKSSVETFLTSHALLGNDFKYYTHNEEAGFNTYTLTRTGRSVQFIPSSLDETDDFTWMFTLQMRRAL